MNLNTLSKTDLIDKCINLGITNYKSKNKDQLIKLIESQNIEFIIDESNVTISNSNNNANRLKLVDLFAGTGAFTYVFDNTNAFETIFANDMLDSSEEIFNLNNKHNIKLTKKNLIDINDIEIPNHDILTGGFPCQPFSIAGQQKGFEDERSNVFWKILSILKTHNPNIVILENVKNLQSHDNGNTFKIIKENLEKLGYYIKYQVLNTCKITNVPQNRERIYIVCFKDINTYNKFEFDFPQIENKNITEFLEPNILDKYYYTNKSSIYDELNKTIIKHINTNTIYQYRRYYVRENKNNVCPTLTANMGTGGHNVPLILDNKGIRKLTPRECFNLQGFPSDYKLPSISDAKLYSLSGNAVSVPVIKLIAEKIASII